MWCLGRPREDHTNENLAFVKTLRFETLDSPASPQCTRVAFFHCDAEGRFEHVRPTQTYANTCLVEHTDNHVFLVYSRETSCLNALVCTERSLNLERRNRVALEAQIAPKIRKIARDSSLVEALAWARVYAHEYRREFVTRLELYREWLGRQRASALAWWRRGRETHF